MSATNQERIAGRPGWRLMAAGRNALRRPGRQDRGRVLVGASSGGLRRGHSRGSTLGADTHTVGAARPRARLRRQRPAPIQTGLVHGRAWPSSGWAAAAPAGPGAPSNPVRRPLLDDAWHHRCDGERWHTVWLDGAGQPVAPPGGQVTMIINAAGRRRRGGRGGRDSVAHLLCAVPARTRPTAASRVGVGMVPDRAPMDNPSLTRTAPHLLHLGAPSPLAATTATSSSPPC